MDSMASSPTTQATSIIPPSTPSPQDLHMDQSQTLDDSPLLDSLQLSPREKTYLEQISTPQTPQLTSPRPVPAYKFPSLRTFISQGTSSRSTPIGSPFHNPSRSQSYNNNSQQPFHSPTASIASSSYFKDLQINELPQSEIAKGGDNRYSVYINDEDFEVFRPPARGKWFKSGGSEMMGHGKSNSIGNIGGRFKFLKGHKKYKSDGGEV